MKSLKEMYCEDVNIMKYFRKYGTLKESNSPEAILCAYDYQAGSYTKNYFSNNVIQNVYIHKGQLVNLKSGEYTRLAAKYMAEVMNKLSFQTILEVGIGEATTICDILENLCNEKEVWGIELSLSRLLYARKFVEQKNKFINLAVGDMFSLPFPDNAIDLVFTYYCIDAHRGREKEAIKEMLRVSSRYLILVEPTYELGNEETRRRIDELKYIKNLKESLEDLDVNIIEYRLFDIFTKNNNAAICVLEKRNRIDNKGEGYVCPVCKNLLVKQHGNMYCEDCYKIYPIIKNIPILIEENAILCSKYLDF